MLWNRVWWAFHWIRSFENVWRAHGRDECSAIPFQFHRAFNCNLTGFNLGKYLRGLGPPLHDEPMKNHVNRLLLVDDIPTTLITESSKKNQCDIFQFFLNIEILETKKNK